MDESSGSEGGAELDGVLEAYMRQRREQLREELEEQRLVVEKGHGVLTEATEAAFLEYLGQSDHVVAHFYHPDFQKCALLDVVLGAVAKEHLEARFLKLNVLESAFFVAKYKIQTLPVLCVYERGALRRKMVGYEGFGLDYPVKDLLCRELGKAGAIQYSGADSAPRGVLGLPEGSESDSR